MEYAFLALFVVSSLLHLYGSLKSDKKLRARTKGFILLSLLGWYCCAAAEPEPVVIAAVLLSWLGDMLLIPDGIKWFALGGTAFGLSHICFILAYLEKTDFSSVPLWAAVAAALVYCAAALLVFRSLKPHLPKRLFPPMLAYLLVNGAMNCFALFQLISLPCLAGAVTYIGATQFFVSDATLFNVRFRKNGRLKTHFLVMLTYIIAEFLIVLGLVLR